MRMACSKCGDAQSEKFSRLEPVVCKNSICCERRQAGKPVAQIVIDTDNFGGDYPNEQKHLFPMTKECARMIADICNTQRGDGDSRFYTTRDYDYELAPGFEP